MKQGLLIGLNYSGSKFSLSGCINDTKDLQKVLIEKLNYTSDKLIVMTDDTVGDLNPSKKNILYQLEKLVDNINNYSVEEAWLSFSGHGTYMRDRNNDEKDGYDECLVPSDCETMGVILDDEIHYILSKITNTNCKLVCLFDCCHSGSILDFKHEYNMNHQFSRIEKIPKRKKIRKGKRFVWRTKFIKRFIPEKWIWIQNNTSKKYNIVCSTFLISGCQDPNTSLDAYYPHKRKWGGVLTNGFIHCIERCNTILTFFELHKELSQYMIHNKLTQRPVLSSSKPLLKSDVFFKAKGLKTFITNN